jgi:hypothetical protein
MDPSVQAALKILDELEPIPTGPVQLSSSYLRAVKKVEDHAENQSGADKTWVGKAIRQHLAFFEQVRLR